jgi:hypothetical protein
LLLYKPFCTFTTNIGLSRATIIPNWENIKGTYHAWHVHHSPVNVEETTIDEAKDNNTQMHPDCIEINEWELLSILIHVSHTNFDELDILGISYFDTNYCWDNPEIPEAVLIFAS